MMRSTPLTKAAILAASLSLAGPAIAADEAAGSESFSERAAQTWQAIKDFGREKGEAAAGEGRALVDEMDETIAEMERRAERFSEAAGQEAREDWNEALARMREMRRSAAKQTDTLGDASGDAWEEAKEGFQAASDAFADAYRDAETEIERAIEEEDAQ